uniref:Uncharacterized protein n=1 Tax=Prymnesium polylepis TaxID=72548 RepID=A0A6V4BK49_9EUKA|mmetsp:Transcript_14683/g.37279  ORF Transcript_14683/g.37279 Transcript_14683/m.37279 type:complete len:615 (+) Transcript_14683:54-1898(+)
MTSVHPISGISYIDARPSVDLTLSDGEPSDESRIEAIRIAFSKVAHGARAAHLKGFTSGVLTSDLIIIGDAIVELLKERKVTVLCWDGDDFADDSFTKVLTRVNESLPHVQCVAFLRSEERHSRYQNEMGFDGSWQSTSLAGNLSVLLCDNAVGSHDRYEHLGVVGLKATCAPLVIAVGGGGVLRKEFDQMLGQGIEYALFDAVRIRDGAEEHAAIIGLDGVVLRPVSGKLSNKTAASECGMLTVAIKVMKIIGIDEKAQTIDLILFIRMEWIMPDGSDPWIDWRDCLSWDTDQKPSKQLLPNGYTSETQTARVTFLQPLDLHHYPFDAHKLEIVLVSNATTDIKMDKLSGVKDAATIHTHAASLFDNSSWRLLRPKRGKNEEPMDPVVCRFDSTPKRESDSEISYVRMSTRLCVERQAEFTIFNVLMPNFILTIFQLMSYAIPREDVSDRLAYHVTVLLAMFAGKLVTVGMLPITSYLTFIDWYMFASYIFVVAIALEVSITKLLVDLPPHAYIEEHALTTTDHASFYTFLGVWFLYHFGFTAVGLRLQWNSRHHLEAWLQEAILHQDRRVQTPRSVESNRGVAFRRKYMPGKDRIAVEPTGGGVPSLSRDRE